MFQVYDAKEIDIHRFFNSDFDGVTPVGQMDHTPDIHEHVTIGGKTYSICCISSRENVCTGKVITDFHGNTEEQDEMICPYCGSEQRDAWELSSDESETECGTCGREFEYRRIYVGCVYTTRRKTVGG